MGINKSYTREDLVVLAAKLVASRLTFGQLDKDGVYLKGGNKGDLGQLVEDCWFGQKPHPDPEPDFKDAKVELKVSPYYRTRNGVSAKERLVCDIINYKNESLPGKTFFESSFWKKCENILLLSYYHAKNQGEEEDPDKLQKRNMFIDHYALIEGFPEEDLRIIMQDWEIIVSKIREGKAHELSEGDTKYLGACTKGDTAENSWVKQPFNDLTPAKQRAYSLKTTYMTRLLRKYIFGEEESSHVIKDVNQLKTISFDDLIIKRINRFKGRTEEAIAKEAGIISKNKSFYARLTNYMLGLGATEEQCEEFKSANIVVRSLHFENDGTLVESVSFPAFVFLDLINQEWESSDLYNDVVSARFLFVIYRFDEMGTTRLETAKFWNMPSKDVDEVHRVWSLTIDEIKKGAGLRKAMWGKKQIIKNDLPGISDSYVAHVRPHTSKAAYLLKDGTHIGNIKSHGDKLPNGEWMTKQCFWLNASYVAKVVRELLNESKLKEHRGIRYEQHSVGVLEAAEPDMEFGETE